MAKERMTHSRTYSLFHGRSLHCGASCFFHSLKLHLANGSCLLDAKLSQAPSGLSVGHNNRTCCMDTDGDGSFKFQTRHFLTVGCWPFGFWAFGLLVLGFWRWAFDVGLLALGFC